MSAPVNTRGLGRADRLARMEHALAVYRPGTHAPRRGRHSRPIFQRLTALAIGLVLLGFLPAVGLFMATREDTAQRIIARAIPTMTELDGLLTLHSAELQARAKADAHTPVALAEFPIDVTLPAGQVAQGSPQRLELLLANRAATAIYHRGAAAFALQGARTTNQTGPVLSSPWAMHRALGLLNAQSHTRFRQAALGLGLMLALLMTMFFLQVGSYGRLVGIGLMGLIAAAAAGLPTLIGWIVVQLNYGGATSPIGSAAWGMISDIAWTMSLIDLAAFICATLLVVIGLMFAQLEHRANRQAVTQPQMAAQPVVELRARGGRPLDRLPKPPRPTN